ncbi:MAG: septum formation initiator family protein [Hyphomicrobiales bacterium]|nr:septum formation initiator family protein [Hyphomicrobiales bacterium]MDE2017012.1 septum formation initiator family protein [Hyphomicrobiales bacterium]
MLFRARVRTWGPSVALWAVSALITGYFAYGATRGDRGLAARREYRREMAGLDSKLADLRADRARWEKRDALLSAKSVDADLLSEESHKLLDFAGADEVVIFDGPQAPR